jgi:acetylglutamate kinase
MPQTQNSRLSDLVVVKIGGHSLAADPKFLVSIAAQLRALQGSGKNLLLLHGGGPQIDAALSDAGIAVRRGADGRRLTDATTMQVTAKALQNLSQDILAALTAAGCAAAVPDQTPIWAQPKADNDFSAYPEAIDEAALRELLLAGQMPVLNSLGRNKEATQLYNINADDAAMKVAVGLQAANLLLATNVMGVWDQDKRPLPILTPDIAQNFIADGTIHGGMIPKIESALAALAAGIGRITILDGHRPEALVKALAHPEEVGTLICNSF